MVDKFIGSKGLHKFLTVLLLITFLISAISFAYPIARKTALIDQLGTQNVKGAQVLAKSISYLEGDAVAVLSESPTVSTGYKRLSGLLTTVAISGDTGRIYVVAKNTSDFVYLLDSNYRDNAKPDTDFFLPGTSFNGAVSAGAQNLVSKIYENKEPFGYTQDIIALSEYENIIVCAAPITDTFGKTVGVLVMEIPAGNADFTKIGAVDFKVTSIIFAVAFAVILVIKILLGRLQVFLAKKRDEKAVKKAEQEKQKLEDELKAKQAELDSIKEAEEKKQAEKEKAEALPVPSTEVAPETTATPEPSTEEKTAETTSPEESQS